MRKIILFGMGRSGTHAVIQWIANGIGGKVRQENNCLQGWDEKKLMPNSVKITGDGELSGVIKSIDDFYLPIWDNIRDWESFDTLISVIRSPRNWLASSIAAKGWANIMLDVVPPETKELTVSRIDAYNNYVSQSFGTRIHYDQWFESEDYRAKIAKEIKINNTKLPRHCKFSSFGKDRSYTGDRYKLLNQRQKKRFNSLIELLKGGK